MSAPRIIFTADYLDGSSVVVKVMVEDEEENPVVLDGASYVSIGEWHRLELAARRPFAEVETEAPAS